MKANWRMPPDFFLGDGRARYHFDVAERRYVRSDAFQVTHCMV